VKSSGVWEATHLFTSGLPPRVMLNGIFYNTSCQGYHNTMINENDACRNDLHWHFKIGCGEKASNNRKLSYGKVQMQNW
jgi:hypothetical protein